MAACRRPWNVITTTPCWAVAVARARTPRQRHLQRLQSLLVSETNRLLNFAPVTSLHSLWQLSHIAHKLFFVTREVEPAPGCSGGSVSRPLPQWVPLVSPLSPNQLVASSLAVQSVVHVAQLLMSTSQMTPQYLVYPDTEAKHTAERGSTNLAR